MMFKLMVISFHGPHINESQGFAKKKCINLSNFTFVYQSKCIGLHSLNSFRSRFIWLINGKIYFFIKWGVRKSNIVFMSEINFCHATICNLCLGHLLVGCDLKIIKASWFDWWCARDDNFVWFSIWKLRNRVPVLTVYYSQVLLHLLNLNSSGTLY